jgi:restriction endonuclease S subunit
MKKEKVSLTTLLTGIHAGFSFRGKVKSDPSGDLSVIQMKDLENDYLSIAHGLTKIQSGKINGRYLKHDDILFLAKGSNNFAIVYDLGLPKAIAASAFFILRPDHYKIIPAYLAWYINQPSVQQFLKGNMAGTYVPNINKSTLEAIMIALPPKAVQEKIVHIDRLRKKEQALVNQIMEKRALAIRAALLDIVNN